MNTELQNVIIFAIISGTTAIVAVITILIIILNRVKPDARHEYKMSHRRFYSMLSQFHGGQVLIREFGYEDAGLIDNLSYSHGGDGREQLLIECVWTISRKNGPWRPHTESNDNETYHNSLGKLGIYRFDKASLYQISDGSVCAVILGAGGVIFFTKPGTADNAEPEDVEGFELITQSKMYQSKR